MIPNNLFIKFVCITFLFLISVFVEAPYPPPPPPQYKFMYFQGGNDSLVIKQFANELKPFYVTDEVLYKFCSEAIIEWIPKINSGVNNTFYIFRDLNNDYLYKYYQYSQTTYPILYNHLILIFIENSFNLLYRIRLLLTKEPYYYSIQIVRLKGIEENLYFNEWIFNF